MKSRYLIFFTLIIFFIGCDDSPTSDTTKNTYYDDISDICFVNGYFFTTNYDLSGNSGDQIDLMRFAGDGSSLDNSFNLSLNGQGFLAMTTDSNDIYLQSRKFGGIYKYSVIGERAYLKFDTVDVSDWLPSGICYLPQKDSLMLLYRNLDNLTEYRSRIVSSLYPWQSGSDKRFPLSFIDTTAHGIWAMTGKDDNYYMLGVDTTIQDMIIRLDADFNLVSTENIPDSTVVGLTFKGDDLYLSYRERRIEYWDSY